MFQSQTICPPRLSTLTPACSGRALLATVAGGALLAAASLPLHVPAPLDQPDGGIFILQADTPTNLRDKVEATRAQLLRQPGVRAVMVSGLHQQRLAVEYAPRILDGYGISPAQLAAGLPVDAALTRPGHIALRTDAGLDSPHDVTDLPVHAGARVFRLGDVALVSRVRLDPPVSDLRVGGQVAARVEVVRGE